MKPPFEEGSSQPFTNITERTSRQSANNHKRLREKPTHVRVKTSPKTLCVLPSAVDESSIWGLGKPPGEGKPIVQFHGSGGKTLLYC